MSGSGVKSTPSMKEVAEKISVSKATVSRVLNRMPGVSDATRERVVQACEQMGYRVNTNIQDLVRETRSGATKNIAMVLVGDATSFFDPTHGWFLDGVANGTDENNYHLVFARLTGKEERIFDLPPILRDRRVDGFVVSGAIDKQVVDLLLQLEIPFVVIGNYGLDISRVPITVEVDFKSAIYEVVGTLKRAGKSKIALFNDHLEHYADKQILSAFKSAIIDQGIVCHDELIYIGDVKNSSAYAMLQPVFDLDKLPFDAVFAPDFRSAIEISHLIAARFGLGDRADIILATSSSPGHYELPVPSIYIEWDQYQVSYNALNLLLDKVQRGRDMGPVKVMVQPGILVKV
ncbi:MAG: LacI family DNA-binding transcriptional regulator [bacterium]|nr:LacI family DNA-binding transcriptional regulator [bacterium]